jgi:hypothetical protein
MTPVKPDTRTVVLVLSRRAGAALERCLCNTEPRPDDGPILDAIRDEIDDQLAGGRHPERPSDATLPELIAARMAKAAAEAVGA